MDFWGLALFFRAGPDEGRLDGVSADPGLICSLNLDLLLLGMAAREGKGTLPL